MNDYKARIILRCQQPRKLMDIYTSISLTGSGSYDRVAKLCSLMVKEGLMVRRKLNDRNVFYHATQEAVNLAVRHLNGVIDEKTAEATTTSIRRLNEFVKSE